MKIPKEWTALPPADIAEKLCRQWIDDERQYRAQVAEAMAKGTRFSGMMAHADQLAACRRAVQEAFGLVLHPDDVDKIATASAPTQP